MGNTAPSGIVSSSTTLPVPSPVVVKEKQPHMASSSADAKGEEASVPVMFRWTHGGQRVMLTGTFNNWKGEIPMVRSGQEFYQVLELPKGVHEYKFIVDDVWKFSSDLPMVHDAAGIVNNVVDTVNYHPYEPSPIVDPLDELAEAFSQEIRDAPTVEPPTIPALLLKSPLIAAQVSKDLAVSSIILEPFSVTERSKPLIAPHAVCMHLFASKENAYVTNLRYRQKISVQVVVLPPPVVEEGNFLKSILFPRHNRRVTNTENRDILSSFTD
jgi:hypothetical protein